MYLWRKGISVLNILSFYLSTPPEQFMTQSLIAKNTATLSPDSDITQSPNTLTPSTIKCRWRLCDCWLDWLRTQRTIIYGTQGTPCLVDACTNVVLQRPETHVGARGVLWLGRVAWHGNFLRSLCRFCVGQYAFVKYYFETWIQPKY